MSFSSKKFRIFLVILVILAGIGVYWAMHLGQESTDDAQLDATVVSISPKVSGYVKELHIGDNTVVDAKAVLLQVDPSDYIIRRDRAAAAVQSAQAQVDIAQANQDKALKDLERVNNLGKLASSRQQVDEVTTANISTEAHLLDAKAKLLLAQSDLSQAEKDLNDTKLIAPIAGRITKRGVELGDYIQTGQQLASLVGNDVHIVANFKETQLKNMRVGQAVDIDIDTYGGQKFHGKIDSFQSGTGSRFSAFPAENATGNFVKIVQRVPVNIVFDTAPNAKLHLGPGMSATVTVYTK